MEFSSQTSTTGTNRDSTECSQTLRECSQTLRTARIETSTMRLLKAQNVILRTMMFHHSPEVEILIISWKKKLHYTLVLGEDKNKPHLHTQKTYLQHVMTKIK